MLFSTINNKTKILQNSYPDKYQLDCNFARQYVDGTKKHAYTIHAALGKWDVSQVNGYHLLSQST